ncbi:MAG: ABC transporter permease subunit [Thermoleophilaceae bacterium]
MADSGSCWCTCTRRRRSCSCSCWPRSVAAHREHDEAAAALGVTPFQRLRWVTWPAVRSPLVVGSIVVFAFVLGAFEVPLALGPSYPSTIAEYARQATQGDLIAGQSTAAAALMVAALASIALAALAVRAARDPQGALSAGPPGARPLWPCWLWCRCWRWWCARSPISGAPPR